LIGWIAKPINRFPIPEGIFKNAGIMEPGCFEKSGAVSARLSSLSGLTAKRNQFSE
jgi:hypothetical protein